MIYVQNNRSYTNWAICKHEFLVVSNNLNLIYFGNLYKLLNVSIISNKLK